MTKELSIVQKLQNIADEINNSYEFTDKFIEKIKKWKQEENIDNDLILKAVWEHRYDSPTLAYSLAVSYRWKVFTEKAHKSAFEWFEKAAENGHIQSLNDLGVCYESGHGIESDMSKAFENYLKAAELGNIDGQSNVGSLYYFGLGTDQDMEKAVYWFRKAAYANASEAQYYLGSFYLDGDGVECDERKAFYWFNLCVRNTMLGECYEQGYGTPVDVHAAIKCFHKAYQINCEISVYEKLCGVFKED
ncbi:994_t:CDS:1 [Ambispora leptoticha]|uniref:994_t:CDS:1 n=1 Tax=Ambispora leptoticha TaxID=144679 RepID=A0A9N9BTF5_9GLOM|nr:994_t:CDS:1 [Ambispora leptoticha]